MPLLTKTNILDAKDLPIERVAVPEWAPEGTPESERSDYFVYIKTMSGLERDRYEASMIDRDGKKVKYKLENVRARLLCRTIVDENSVAMFTQSDVTQLGLKSASALTRLWDVAQRLAGITEADVDDYVGNSKAETSDDSPLD